MKLGMPTKIVVRPQKDGEGFLFLLSFRGRSQPVEFETNAVGAMGLLAALNVQQKRFDLPVPKVAPLKPKLRLVKPEEE